jgi:hypothetical protein
MRVIRALRQEQLVLLVGRLVAQWGPLVDAAVRRRPLFQGAPFTLPGHKEDPGS